MFFCNPTSPEDLDSRNHLLQTSMRPKEHPFSIVNEYPTVLDTSNSKYSYCIKDGKQIIAHANLWPRDLSCRSTGKTYKIGFVGNVCTHESRRGEGLTKNLFANIKQQAESNQLDALLLWSNLSQFYQKLGFQSVGKEWRLQISDTSEPHIVDLSGQYFPIDPSEVSDEDLETMIQLRYPTDAEIGRSIAEFKKLLHIPATVLFIKRNDIGKIGGYVVVGKGFDMIGVIHEWGVKEPDDIIAVAKKVKDAFNSTSTLMLSPSNLPSKWFEFLTARSSGFEEHHMALISYLRNAHEVEETINKGFIWGLDSI